MECAAVNECLGRRFRVDHFGEVHPAIADELRQSRLPIQFHGYAPDWISRASDICFFFSNYEGFGLAAFEAAKAGHRVFVNGGFPIELLEACPGIRMVDTRHAWKPILTQVVDAFRHSH